MQKKLAELADLIGGVLVGGDAARDIVISGVTNIEDAGPEDITFAVPPHLEKAARSRAGAVVVPEEVTEFARPAVRVANPRAAFARLLELYTPPPAVERGVHPAAIIGRDVALGQNVAVMAYAVVGDGASIGDNAIIYPHVYIGPGAIIGRDTVIYPNATVREGCRIGERVIIHSAAVIGSDGFGFVTIDGRHRKVPQVGNVVIGDDVEIGANVAIDRATTGSTVIKQGTKIDNLVHIGHNCVIGENCLVVAQTGISGSVTVGNNVTFAGQTGIAGHITIGDNCLFAARAGISGNIPSNSFYAGFPLQPHAEWLRTQGAILKLSEYVKRVRSLERRLSELEKDREKQI